MLDNLKTNNFKCLQNFDYPLGSLTLLTGPNGTGKSSVIQSLALLHQTASENEWSHSIYLNGSFLELGTMSDVIDRNSGGNGFGITLSGADWKCIWQTTSKNRTTDRVALIDRVEINQGKAARYWSGSEFLNSPMRRLVPEDSSKVFPEVFKQLQTALSGISYISAERLGPREVYSVSKPMELPDVGSRGELTASCLEQFELEKCNPGVILPGVADQVRLTLLAWMALFFGGVGYETKPIEFTNLILLGIRTSAKGQPFRPSNVGFGITHLLPILTACIVAQPGRILLIENPETHLHPAAQSQVGSFLALAASAGVQIILETHSDHVLNGVRRAVHDKKLPATALKVYFFQPGVGENNEPSSSVIQVDVDDRGMVSNWPDGFFDQFESDLNHIFQR